LYLPSDVLGYAFYFVKTANLTYALMATNHRKTVKTVQPLEKIKE